MHYRAVALAAAALTLLAGPGAFAKPKPVTTASGLIFQSLHAGKGASPTVNDVVTVNYKGMLADGTVFDSSYDRHAPAQFPLAGVIPCWTEGVQLMKVGGKAQLTCPAAIAYGERGAGDKIPLNATLTFEVELLGIVPPETAPAP